MNNKQYVEKVNASEFPEEVQVPLDKPYEDDRGIIQNIWLGHSGSATYITSKKGSVRAEHIHKLECHGCFIISGSIEYTERDNEGKLIFKKTFNEGEMFFSKPGVWHKMKMLEDTKMITLNNIVKSHDNYENDLIRIKYNETE